MMGIPLTILTVSLLLWLILYPGTDYLIRYFGPILRKTSPKSMVALTFDDGPDPEYTPEILDILRRFGAKATFFLVGNQMQKYPELVRQIQADGHEIALHSQRHHHAYTLLLGAFREVSAARESVEGIVNTPVYWYRPPWGAFNFLTLWAIGRHGLKPVTWSVNANDWMLKTGSERVRQLVRERIHPGAVIVLHDHGGDPGAPAQTLAALPGILSDLAELGLKVVTLSDIYFNNDKEGANHG